MSKASQDPPRPADPTASAKTDMIALGPWVQRANHSTKSTESSTTNHYSFETRG